MTFSSIEFLFLFLPAFLALYFVSRNATWRNVALFGASILFYAWGEPVFVVLMLGSVVVNYGLALLLDSRGSVAARRAWFVVGLVFNIALLFAFKYVDFGLGIFAAATGSAVPALHLPLPLGISFYSFQALAYLIDLYRGEYPAERNLVRLGVVIAAFPTITAGPILRFKNMRDQLDTRVVSTADAARGLRRILIGLGKKVLIANNVAFLATQIFANGPSQYGATGAWIGAISWTLQIYFDFSGYSDMALGIGTMLGFRYPENFNYPYIAQSVSDFWRRWHMSLSSFFRDYVYIPLGGNRVTMLRWIFNMFVVWGLTGLWHGANWTFVAWGLYFGTLLVIERYFLARLLDAAPRFVRHLYVLAVVVAGWVLFMSPTIGAAADILKAMVGGYGMGDIHTLVLMRVVQPMYIVAFVAGIVGSMPWVRSAWAGRVGARPAAALAIDLGLVVVFVTCTAMAVIKAFEPFLYFKF